MVGINVTLQTQLELAKNPFPNFLVSSDIFAHISLSLFLSISFLVFFWHHFPLFGCELYHFYLTRLCKPHKLRSPQAKIWQRKENVQQQLEQTKYIHIYIYPHSAFPCSNFYLSWLKRIQNMNGCLELQSEAKRKPNLQNQKNAAEIPSITSKMSNSE